MARRKDLTDEEILRMARIRITESALSTFTQGELQTQLSVERGVIWMVHWCEFFFPDSEDMTEVQAAGSEKQTAQVTRESKTALIDNSDSDMLQSCELKASRSAAIGTDAGPLWYTNIMPVLFHYPIPMPIASQSIFVGLQSSDANVTTRVDVRIGYTIREVSDKFFFRVAQALVG